MVWFHSGGFQVGDSTYDTYGPDLFLNEEIVFVSFNYRVGIFGKYFFLDLKLYLENNIIC